MKRRALLALPFLASVPVAGSDSGFRRVRLDDLPGSLVRLAGLPIATEEFAEFITRLSKATRERVADGEWEHLIYYVLQSASFTDLPRVEPALSARDFAGRIAPSDRDAFFSEATSFEPEWKDIPPSARARLLEFLHPKRPAAADGRFAYFRRVLGQGGTGAAQRALLTRRYARAMRFLYAKEFLPRGNEGPAELYRERAHSTDTRLAANYAVFEALSVVKTLDPGAKLSNALVVGPGLDIAPRTGLTDAYPPQSFQPFILADSILRLNLAAAPELRIISVDVNPRVVGFLDEFLGRADKRLHLFSDLQDEEFLRWFRACGSALGTETAAPRAGIGAARTVRLGEQTAQTFSAQETDVVTSRLQPSPGFDLVIATNVLLYFSRAELALALANISAMMNAGAYFIHNEFRDEVSSFGGAAGLEVIHARTIRLQGGDAASLYDGFVIQRKTK